MFLIKGRRFLLLSLLIAPLLFAGGGPLLAQTGPGFYNATINATANLSQDSSSVNINARGELSIRVRDCPDTFAVTYIDQLATDGTVTIVNHTLPGGGQGPLIGQTIPAGSLRVNSGEQGWCASARDTHYYGRRSTYNRSRTFDTSTYPEGRHTLELEVVDNYEGVSIDFVSFIIDRPDVTPPPPPPPPPASAALTVRSRLDGTLTPGAAIQRVSGTAAGGTTQYTRQFDFNINTVLRAPATHAGGNFVNWTGCNSTGGTGGRDCSVSVSTGSAKTIVANYTTPDSEPPPPPDLVCSPSSQTVETGEDVTVTASGGTPNYGWRALGSTNCATFCGPANGINPFTTSYNFAGSYKVTVTDQGGGGTGTGFQQVECSVTVTAPVPQPGTIRVVSNQPTKWTITGGPPTNTINQTTFTTSRTYSNKPSDITYTISNIPALPGFTGPVIEPCNSQNNGSQETCAQTLEPGEEIVFTITYTPIPPPASAALTVRSRLNNVLTPGAAIQYVSGTSGMGGTTEYTRQIDLNINTVLRAPATFSGGNFISWTGCNSVGGTGGRDCTVSVATGSSKTVNANYTGQPVSETLSVSLTPNPASGPAPLSTDLVANVSGTATGSINYSFWWNCAYAGTSLQTAINQCGAPSASGNASGRKFDGVPSETQTAPHTYPSPGVNTAKVIAERGTAPPATDSATVTVTPPDTGNTHAECFNNTCVQVSGGGPDRCASNSDCGGGGGDFHAACNAVQRACVNVSGSGPSTCSTDPACFPVVTPSHLECQNNACVIVGGAGTNTCSAVGSDCTIPPTEPPGGDIDCTFTATPTLIARGGFSKLQWTCGSGISSCTVTNDATGAQVGAGGPVNQEPGLPVSPLETTDYRLTCNSPALPGAFTGTATVRVLSIVEVPPR